MGNQTTDIWSIQRAAQSLPPETTRCTRLFGLSVTGRETWLQQRPLLDIIHHFLRTITKPYHWREDGVGNLATDPILSAAATLDIGPGVKAQGLHRDDFIWQKTHEIEQERYLPDSDVGIGLLVAGVKTRAENGATLFVPGSHLWADSRLPKAEEAVPVEMDVREAFLFLAQENQHLWWTREEVQQWSVAAQKQAGYLIDHPFLGYCDETDPIKLFRANDQT
ncbi:hypothetical protein OEA41_005900 [Lepraria neglecta]|uniref:Uncharacterized protein n=1 Tax=Lepraria neglecta TaxID=209136 RepID=A0AAD9Z6X4_9LECA|nr:hypothetical protein OEA41_005900 [Lepraria neglecta]